MSVYKNEKPLLFNMALASICEQTKPATRVVLVIDGPISAELETIVAKYLKLLPMCVFRLEENLGLASALDYGIKKCETEWIVRCDSDDYNAEDRFEILSELIDTFTDDIAVIGSSVVESNIITGEAFSVRYFPEVVSQLGLLLRDPVAHPATAVRKNAVVSVGGYSGPLYFEDTYLWLRLLNSGYKFINTNKVLVRMSVDDDYFKRRRGVKYAKYEYKAFNRFLKEKLIDKFSVPIVAIRILIRFLPQAFFINFYKYILRKQ